MTQVTKHSCSNFTLRNSLNFPLQKTKIFKTKPLKI